MSETRAYEFKCHHCGIVKTYELPIADYKRWKNGALIQNVFAYIEDRDIMISQTCSDCFDKLFADEDGDE